MVSVDNKAISEITNISNSTKKVTNEGLDSIFAELFSLVDMSSIEDVSSNDSLITNKSIEITNKSIEITKESAEKNLIELINNQFIGSETIQKSDKNLIKNEEASIEAAKSLISIFYKEALLDEEIETDNTKLSVENPNNSVEKTNYNLLNNLNLVQIFF